MRREESDCENMIRDRILNERRFCIKMLLWNVNVTRSTTLEQQDKFDRFSFEVLAVPYIFSISPITDSMLFHQQIIRKNHCVSGEEYLRLEGPLKRF